MSGVAVKRSRNGFFKECPDYKKSQTPPLGANCKQNNQF